MLPYGDLFLLICAWAVVQHLRDTTASRQSKRVVLVASVVTLAVLILTRLPFVGQAAAASTAAYTILYRLTQSSSKAT